MEQATQRTTVRGPTFIRLLASLADIDTPQSRQSLSDRLSHWLDWTHAIALSTALDGKAPEPGSDAPAFDSAEEDACTRARASLAAAIGEREWPALRQRGAHARAEEDAQTPVDYTVFRQRYVSLQRSMQTATGNLRGRLREMLIGGSADMARLAEVDAAMELALSPREQMLLATVPTLLGKHFEHLQQTGPKMLAGPPAPDALAVAPGAWLEVFRKDMQSLLLAELDVRFQPVEGLLAALRTH